MNIRSIIRWVQMKIFRRKLNLSKQLVSDLSFVTPDYCKNMIEKYGNENWALTADEFNRTMNKAQSSYIEDKLKLNGN